MSSAPCASTPMSVWRRHIMTRLFPSALLLAFASSANAASPDQIIAANTRAMVFLQVEDASGKRIDSGSGFIVSHDGFLITAAHIKADPTQTMWGYIGQRDGTRYRLNFRDRDEVLDTALWQFPQSASCRYAVTLSSKPVKLLDRVLVLGFPGKDGLTPSGVNINNLTSPRGFLKADGYLREGNSGGSVFNETGYVVAIVQGGTLPGTENNDLVPISAAINLIKKWNVQAGIDAPMPFDNGCYASCRAQVHGVEGWSVQTPCGPKYSGKLPGGHSRRAECNKIIASDLANNPGAEIELLPGEGVPNTTGMWESRAKTSSDTLSMFTTAKALSAPGRFTQKSSRRPVGYGARTKSRISGKPADGFCGPKLTDMSYPQAGVSRSDRALGYGPEPHRLRPFG
jgi:hypothetical protein